MWFVYAWVISGWLGLGLLMLDSEEIIPKSRNVLSILEFITACVIAPVFTGFMGAFFLFIGVSETYDGYTIKSRLRIVFNMNNLKLFVMFLPVLSILLLWLL